MTRTQTRTRDEEDQAMRLAFRTWDRLRPIYAANPHLDLGAIEGAALLGAAKALARFDSERGCGLSSLVIRLVRCEILEEVRNQDHLTRALRRDAQQIENETGRRPGWADSPISLEVIAGLNDEDDGPGEVPQVRVPVTMRVTDTVEDLEDEVLGRVTQEKIQEALSHLPARTQKVLRGLFWEEKSWEEIAREIGVSPDRIPQIRRESMGRLRVLLEGWV